MAQGPQDALQRLHEHLVLRWVLWGLVPLAACAVLVLLGTALAPPGIVHGKQETRLAFDIVLAFGAAVFLAAFYIDGYWTSSDRIAAKLFRAAGADASRSPSSWAQSSSHRARLREHSDIALRTVTASADTMTALGGLIALAAVAAIAIGLQLTHAGQVLVLGLSYQLYLFSRHPYYERLAETATRGELIPPEDKDEDDPSH